MRVLVFDGPHRMHIDEWDLPGAGPGEVRVRVARAGICGSDLHGYTGESGRRVPGMVMGHEASGWIEALGPGVEGVEPGEAVTFNPTLPCDGSCGHLEENRCARLRVIGVTSDLQGAFADALVVPAGRVVPTGPMPLEWAAAVEPMAVGLQAVRQTQVEEGHRVVVLGGGMIGQCLAQAARLAGAVEVVVSDPLAERRRLAAACGFRGVAPEEVEGLQPFDRAIDAVGSTATAEAAIRAVPKGARVGFVGLGVPEVTIPLFDLVVGERTVVGSFCYTDQIFREAARLVAEGSLVVAPLIGVVVDFQEVPTVFEELATAARTEAKILMTTGAEPPHE